MRKRSWTENELRKAVESSRSIRQILKKLKLREAGGNYAQIKKYLNFYKINTKHLTGRSWNKGLKMPYRPKVPIKDILIVNSDYQSYKLKARLIKEGFKSEKCEKCGWNKKSKDGKIPLELDHINGNSRDNRINNLRILCPNCHSLEPTHRGRNRNI